MPEDKNQDEKVTSIKPEDNNQDSQVKSLQEQLNSAQKKIEEQGKQLREASDYIRDANMVATVIQDNPELQEGIRQGIAQKYGGQGVNQQDGQQQDKGKSQEGASAVENEKIKEHDEKLSRTERSQRDLIINTFERDTGISNLPLDRQKEVRAEVERYLNTFGQSVEDVPIERLNRVLGTAFEAVNNKKIADEGAAAAYTNMSGAFGAVKPNSSEEGDEKRLSGKQKEWAEKFGLDTNKVKDNWFNEEPFIPKAERKPEE